MFGLHSIINFPVVFMMIWGCTTLYILGIIMLYPVLNQAVSEGTSASGLLNTSGIHQERVLHVFFFHVGFSTIIHPFWGAHFRKPPLMGLSENGVYPWCTLKKRYFEERK